MSIYYSIKDIKSVDEAEEYEYEYSDSLFFNSFDVGCESSFVDSIDEHYEEVSNDVDYPSGVCDENVNVENYTIILYAKERDSLDIWNDILKAVNEKSSLGDIDYLYEMLRVVDETGLVDYKATVSKIYHAIRKYKDHLNDGVGLSSAAVFQLVRYVPFFSCKKNIDFYLEKDTGYIGVIIPMKKNKKGTLNLTIMSTSEVYYSYVRKKTGLVKFSGKGFLGDDLKNSDAIMSILKMSDW